MQAAINNFKRQNRDFFSVIESVQTRLAGQEAHKIVYDGNGRRNMFIFTIKGSKVS